MHNVTVRGRRTALFVLATAVVSLLLAVSPVFAATATIVRHVVTDKKIIALTFDDGYSPTRALKIVSILDQYGATGTFFPYSNAADDAPYTWRTIAKRFPIGNHTVSHPNLTKLTASQIYYEINHARVVIENMTGRPMIRVFRPPYMYYNTTVLEQSYRAGFKTVALWSVDSGDALGVTDDQFYNRAIAGKPGGIVLMHAGPAVTVRNLGRVLAYYKNHGYTFVTIPKLLGMAWSPATTVTTTAVDPPSIPDPAQLLPISSPLYVRPTPLLYREIRE